ncbi:MAG: hypothetical protein AMS21_00870 [Gemmatimonas sp. SG8_38_2]|nr:MAG: hypothetical protein AMS21_00870 [Gemmatimonas sp. SG8_38_2]
MSQCDKQFVNDGIGTYPYEGLGKSIWTRAAGWKPKKKLVWGRVAKQLEQQREQQRKVEEAAAAAERIEQEAKVAALTPDAQKLYHIARNISGGDAEVESAIMTGCRFARDLSAMQICAPLQKKKVEASRAEYSPAAQSAYEAAAFRAGIVTAQQERETAQEKALAPLRPLVGPFVIPGRELPEWKSDLQEIVTPRMYELAGLGQSTSGGILMPIVSFAGIVSAISEPFVFFTTMVVVFSLLSMFKAAKPGQSEVEHQVETAKASLLLTTFSTILFIAGRFSRPRVIQQIVRKSEEL